MHSHKFITGRWGKHAGIVSANIPHLAQEFGGQGRHPASYWFPLKEWYPVWRMQRRISSPKSLPFASVIWAGFADSVLSPVAYLWSVGLLFTLGGTHLQCFLFIGTCSGDGGGRVARVETLPASWCPLSSAEPWSCLLKLGSLWRGFSRGRIVFLTASQIYSSFNILPPLKVVIQNNRWFHSSL